MVHSWTTRHRGRSAYVWGMGCILKSRMGESVPCQESATGELGLATVLAYADTEVTALSGLIRPGTALPTLPSNASL